MENYKADLCIFFQNAATVCASEFKDTEDKYNNHLIPSVTIKKLLKSIYLALQGDLLSSPNFDVSVNVSLNNDCIIISIEGDDLSKFRASILNFLQLVYLIYLII